MRPAVLAEADEALSVNACAARAVLAQELQGRRTSENPLCAKFGECAFHALR